MGAAISLQFILGTGIWILPIDAPWTEELKPEELGIDKESLDLIPKDILDVPKEFLELLCDRLSFTDQLQFARVCKSWHSLAFGRPDPKAYETPWLIGLTEGPTFRGSIYNQVTCHQIRAKSFKHSKPHIIGSFKGWLYLQYKSINLTQLVNMFSNIHHDLPRLSTIKNFTPSDIKHVRAFAVSLCNFMGPIMIAIVSSLGNLALCKIGGRRWKGHKKEEQYINLTFCKSKLYAMRKEFNRVDINETDDKLELSLVAVIDSSEVIDASLPLPPPFQAYLLGDSKDNNLVLVLQHRKMLDSVLMAIEFEIFKIKDGDQLVKVDTLDDQIVLLSDSCSEIIDVKDCLPSTFFPGNQICFTTGFDYDLGIYSFKYETTEWLLPFRKMYCLHWIFPRLIASQCNCESHPKC
ncbi:uncharacterized protein LOC129320718 [Prosopis cineraria]|uniref:uncharacterized protein LOC129320718 n=1 Tax=Prosopis cineraria TaxID=364024 RepID=UPI00240F4965|nr:uncharacterized protein LOC129320718 [Prosopis cineraria]XP_054822258.1 uncharacterized protein LOC129320718 [Prosopis cineraria]